MNYEAARGSIRAGDILAVRGTSLMSRVIEAVTGGPWSHVGVAWWLEDRLMVIQQREIVGCQIVPASLLLPFDWISTDVTLTPCARSVAVRMLGKPYSYLDALRIGLQLGALHKARTCSTFAATVLDLSGYSVPAGKHQSPASLVAALVADGRALASVE